MIIIALTYRVQIMCQLLSYSYMYFVNLHDYCTWELLYPGFSSSPLSHSQTTYNLYPIPHFLEILFYEGCWFPTFHGPRFTYSQTIDKVWHGESIWKWHYWHTITLRTSLQSDRKRKRLFTCTTVLVRYIHKSRLRLLKVEARGMKWACLMTSFLSIQLSHFPDFKEHSAEKVRSEHCLSQMVVCSNPSSNLYLLQELGEEV